MILEIKFDYEQKYHRTKRCRKENTRILSDTTEIVIRETTTDKFPLAFIVHDYKSVCERMISYEDHKGSDFRMFDEGIRTFDGVLYAPCRYSYGTAISTVFLPKEKIAENIEASLRYRNSYYGSDNFTEESVTLSDNKEDVIETAREEANKFVYCNGVFWEKTKEPVYVINTFGLGYNHGGTAIFIENFYNDNIPSSHYFNALERDKAIAFGKEIATKRGDTKSIPGFGDNDIIEVIMPEMVKRCPGKEHGDGDETQNRFEKCIESAGDPLTAGLLVMMSALK